MAGTAVALIYYFVFSPKHAIPATFNNVLSAVVDASGTVFGFLLAAASILVGIRDSWYLKRSKEAGLYVSLVGRLFIAMWWCLGVAVLSLAALSFDPAWKLSWYAVGISFWLFCVTTALGTTIRAIRIFVKLFRLIAEE